MANTQSKEFKQLLENARLEIVSALAIMETPDFEGCAVQERICNAIDALREAQDLE